jgi:hypothetical protein
MSISGVCINTNINIYIFIYLFNCISCHHQNRNLRIFSAPPSGSPQVACHDMFQLMDRASLIEGLEPTGETPEASPWRNRTGHGIPGLVNHGKTMGKWLFIWKTTIF